MADLSGKVLLNRYRVDEFLGRGGMADVYKVWDSQRATYLAMKILHADLAEDKVFLRRFKREAQTLAKLQHPNIVRFYGLEQDDEIAFILMDYIEGSTLRKEIFRAQSSIPLERVLEIMKPVCSALHYAHQSGVVHADIKPANIMIHNNGIVLVADFGIARATESATATMVGAGTPAYMPPEQARGQVLTPQSDIYSLGIVLYEMLTGGERPFTGERARITGGTTEKIIWEQLNAEPPSMRAHNPGLPAALENVALSMLDKDSAYRPATTLDVLNALSQAAVSPTPVPVDVPVPVAALSEPDLSAAPAPVGAPEPIPDVPVAQENAPVQPQLKTPPTSTAQLIPWRKYVPIGVLAILLGLGLVVGLSFLNLGRRDAPAVEVPVVSDTTTSGPTATKTPTPTVTATFTALPTPTFTPTLAPTATSGIGSTMISEKDGMAMMYVPAGEFIMGAAQEKALELCSSVYWVCKKSWFFDVAPERKVFLDAFWIDTTEITNQMYRGCVESGTCEIPPLKDTDEYSGNNHFYTALDDSSFDNYPVVRVSWYDAKKYCDWAGKRLPTEAEWEKAARGIDGRNYPWGNRNPNSTLMQDKAPGTITTVGNFPLGASPYGVLDMVGNVYEWVFDWYSPSYYSDGPIENPTGPGSGKDKSLRGGYPLIISNSAPLMIRNWANPLLISNHVGFRCAMDANQNK